MRKRGHILLMVLLVFLLLTALVMGEFTVCRQKVLAI